MADKPRKILVIRFSSIGDIVLTSPVLRCLYNQLPGSEIHYVTKARYASLVANNPHLAKVHILEEKGLESLTKQLKAERFDFVVDLHNSLRSHLLRLRLGVKGKAFPKLNIEKWLLVNFRINRLPDIHIVQRYLKAAQPLGIQNDGKGLECNLPASLPDADRLLRKLTKPYVAIAIGGNYATKRLPIPKLVELIRKIERPCVLLGGPEDKFVGERISLETGAIDTCGTLTIMGSAKIIQESSCLISHDTGMMHLGAALQVAVISIWGNTIPEFGMTPYYGDDQLSTVKSRIFEVSGLSCRPCSKLGHKRCPKGHFKCMYDQDTAAIAQLVSELTA